MMPATTPIESYGETLGIRLLAVQRAEGTTLAVHHRIGAHRGARLVVVRDGAIVAFLDVRAHELEDVARALDVARAFCVDQDDDYRVRKAVRP